MLRDQARNTEVVIDLGEMNIAQAKVFSVAYRP